MEDQKRQRTRPSNTTTVKEIAKSSTLNLFPNPASEIINIELRHLKNIANATITMYDITGKKIIEKQINHSTMETISVTELAPGLYTILISDANSILGKQKVVLQK